MPPYKATEQMKGETNQALRFHVEQKGWIRALPLTCFS